MSGVSLSTTKGVTILMLPTKSMRQNLGQLTRGRAKKIRKIRKRLMVSI